ncbi:MAG: TetR/AcrR family transcriptional regulator [Anaerolineae bacterium]|nr:TetR/AcrR family transcriptional regulator [Anaerolineae bacterium]
MTPQDSDQKAQQILNAARKVLAQQGYAATTIKQVAAEAGVSRGLLHYYFENKEDMLARVVEASGEATIKLVQMLFEQSQSADDLASGLTGALRNIELVAPDLFPLFFESWSVSRQSPTVAHELKLLFQQSRQAFHDALEEAAARGMIAPAVPLEGLAALLMGILDGLALQRITEPEIADNDAIWTATEAAIRELLSGKK